MYTRGKLLDQVRARDRALDNGLVREYVNANLSHNGVRGPMSNTENN